MANPRSIMKKKEDIPPADSGVTLKNADAPPPIGLCRLCGVQLPALAGGHPGAKWWCPACAVVQSETLVASPTDTLDQIAEMATLLEQAAYWIQVDHTPMRETQLYAVSDKAAGILNTVRYPVKLTEAAWKLASYQDQLSESMSRWAKSVEGGNNWGVLLSALVQAFTPLSIDLRGTIGMHVPSGHVVIRADKLHRTLGISGGKIMPNTAKVEFNLEDLLQLRDVAGVLRLTFHVLEDNGNAG